MGIKKLTRGLIVSTVMAGSLIVFPQLSTHQASAAAPTIKTTHQFLHSGSIGSSVRAVQEKLKLLGYYHDTIDGYYGPNTKRAVMAYQKSKHIKVDGIAGPVTLSTLFNTSSRVSVKPAKKVTTSKITSPKKTIKTQSVTTGLTSTLVNSIISDAKSLQGVPYKWGGTTPSGFDCSGFIGYVFGKNGIKLPRTAAQQYAFATPVSSPQPGDLVFFTTYKAGPSHSGIYIGNNEFISATSSKGIAITNMNNPYWKPRYLGAKRILNNTN